MKKNIVLSSVAAVAVAGMLVLSGCGGNSGSTKSNNNVDDSKTAKISVVAGTPSSVKVSFGNSKKDHGQDDLTVTVKEIRCGDDNTVAACESKCTAVNPCEVKVETGCGVVDTANNTLVNGTSAEAANAAFAAAAGAKDKDGKLVGPADGEFIGFDGVTVLTSDNVNSCTIDYSAFIVCAMDKDGKKYYVSQDAPNIAKGETGAEAVEALVSITTIVDGKEVIEWKRVPLEWKSKQGDDGVLSGQPFVNLENLALNGHLPAKIKVYTILKVAGSKSHGDKVTGVSGGTGAVGE
jgi:flagellin-like hook-associated protein FlgL